MVCHKACPACTEQKMHGVTQTSITSVGLKPMTPVDETHKTIHALDHASALIIKLFSDSQIKLYEIFT